MHSKYINLYHFSRICINPWTLLVVIVLGWALVVHVLTWADLERDVARGEVVHQPFHVAIILDQFHKSPCVDCTMDMIPILQKKHVNSTFLMPEKKAKNECGDEYTVLDSSAGTQTIVFKTEWTLSRYRATEKTIEPLYSRSWRYSRFNIQGLIVGFCLGLLTYVLGYFLMRKYSS